MAFTELRPLTDREVRTLLPATTGPEPTLEPIPDEELSSLLPEPTLADRAAGIVNAIPTPMPDFSMPTLPKTGGEFLDKIPFPKMIEKAGREVKDTVQSSLGEIVSEPPPTKVPFTDIPVPEKARDLIQIGKAGLGGTLATAAELAPFTPSEFANWATFELAPGELAQAFPKTAKFLNADISGPIASRLRYTINQIKYKLGIPQETGMVSWAKGAMARGEITPAEAARMDQSIYDSMLEERNKLPATESGSEPRTPASEQPAEPLPSAITPADLPSADLANAVAMAPKPYALPSFGPQMDPESVAMTASKMSQAMGVTAQNVLDAMNAAAQGTDEMASNAAFFARLPLRQVLTRLGVQPEAMESLLEALKAGDPQAARTVMDKLVSSDPALSEVLPRVEEVMAPAIQDMIAQASVPEAPATNAEYVKNIRPGSDAENTESQFIADNFDAFDKAYDVAAGNRLSSDLVKTMDMDGREPFGPGHSVTRQKAGQAFIETKINKLLADQSQSGKDILITAGITGAGKTTGLGQAKPTTIDNIRNIRYNQDEVRRTLNEFIESEHAKGNLSTADARSFLGHEPRGTQSGIDETDGPGQGRAVQSPQSQPQGNLNQPPKLEALTDEEVARLVPTRPTKKSKYKPETFTQFVASKGIDPAKSPDIQELEMSHLHRRGGHSLDGIRELGVEAGFLPEDATENDVIEFLQDEKLGRKHYSVQDSDAYDQIEQPLETYSEVQLKREIAFLESKEKPIAAEKKQLKALKAELSQREPQPIEETDFPYGENVSEPGAEYGKEPITSETPTGYEKVPNSLMGFRRSEMGRVNVPFDESKFPYTMDVRVKLEGGDTFEDSIKGMNRKHAMERAKRNWVDYEEITELPKQTNAVEDSSLAEPEFQAILKKAQEIQGELPLEKDLAVPMKQAEPTPQLVAQSNVDTKLVESGHLDFTSLTYEGPETAVAGLYHLKSETNENVYFLLLKDKKIVGVDHNAIGSPNHADINIERVLKIAKKAGADEIIPVHNHPSGKVKASKDDLKMTHTLRKTASQFGLTVGEHVIIDHGEYGVIDRDNVPSIHKFTEPKERSLKVKILKMSQERTLEGNYQGRRVGNSLQAADVMKELIDKNKNTVFAMILNNQLGINAVTAIATGKEFTTKIADTIADAVINHAGVNVVLVANEKLNPGLLTWIAKKLQPLQATLKDMIFPDATFSEYTSLAEDNPEYFDVGESDGKYGVSEDEPAFVTREKAEKKAMIEEIKKAVTLKALSNVTVSRLRSSFNIKAMKTAKIEDLKKLKEFIDTLKAGDRFISDKQLAALKEILKDVERPDITPRRILIDQFGDKEEVMSGPVTGKIANELIPTVDIKEGHPLIKKIVDAADAKIESAISETSRRDENFEEMLSKAEGARATKLSPMQRLARKLAPQNKEIFQAMSGQQVDLTKEEAGVVAYLRNFFKKVAKDLELEKVRKNYVTHMEKPLLEKMLTEGPIEAALSLFKSDKPLNIPVNVMLELDNIIGGEKFFKYVLERKGGLRPSTNLRRVLHGYSSLYETKKALDAILPEGQAITQLLLKDKSAKWLKRYLQNLKGRGLDHDFRFGKMGWISRLADQIVSLGYIKLLALNWQSALKNVLAGESNSFAYQDISKFLLGKQRFILQPIRVFEMGQEFGIFDGTYTDYATQGLDKLQKLGDLMMIGQQAGEIEIRGSLFAGELTPEEWTSGNISPERIREIKNTIAITQGIFSKTESPLLLQTWYGRMFFQMNRWRITNAMLFRRVAIAAQEEVKQGNYSGPNLRRLSKLFLVWGIGLYVAYEFEKARMKQAAGIAKAMGETISSLLPQNMIAAIVKSIRDNPTLSLLNEFAYTVEELAAYVGGNKPKKIQMRKGIENTYVAPVKTLKDILGIKDKKGKATYYKNPEGRKMEATLK